MCFKYEIGEIQTHPRKFKLLRLPLTTYHQDKNILILLYDFKPFLFLLSSKNEFHNRT